MKELEFLGNAKTSDDLPNYQEMEMLMKYCEIMAKAPAYAAMGGMPGIFALVMTARELGIGPMSALNGGMYLIPPGKDKDGNTKGNPTIMMAAKTMSMMIWKSGHKIEVIEANDNQVVLKGTRADNGVEMTVTMNMKKAQIAQLSHDGYGKPKLWSTWFKNPEDMLWKTCVAKLGRRLFTDVIGNAYEPSEFEEKESKEGVEDKPKKTLKGKQVVEIETSPQSEPLKIEEQKAVMTYQEFIDKYNLHPDLDTRDQNMMKFVETLASKRKKGLDEALSYCYDNFSGFMQAYKAHAEKEGIDISNIS